MTFQPPARICPIERMVMRSPRRRILTTKTTFVTGWLAATSVSVVTARGAAFRAGSGRDALHSTACQRIETTCFFARRARFLAPPSMPLIGAVRAAQGCGGPSVERAQVLWPVQTLDAFPAGLAAGFVVAQRPVSHDLSSGAVRQPAPALAAQVLVAGSQTPMLGRHDALNLWA